MALAAMHCYALSLSEPGKSCKK